MRIIILVTLIFFTFLSVCSQTLASDLKELYRIYMPETISWIESQVDSTENLFWAESLISDNRLYEDITHETFLDTLNIYRVSCKYVEDGPEFILISDNGDYRIYPHTSQNRYNSIIDILDLSAKYPDILTCDIFHSILTEIIHPSYMFCGDSFIPRLTNKIGQLKLYSVENNSQ